LYGAGTANNYLGGALNVGISTITSRQSGWSTIQNGKTFFTSRTSDSYTIIGRNFYIGVTGNNIYVDNGTCAALQLVDRNLSFFSAPSGTAGNNPTFTQHFELYGATGNLVLQNGGTFTDAGFRLDVNGTARVSGNLTALTFQGAANVQFQYTGNNTYVRLEETGSSSNGILFNVNNTTNSFKFKHNNLFSFTLGYGIGNGARGAWFGSNASLVVVDASAQVQIDSTTKGFLPPRGTNTQMLAIASPATGLMFYDTTNNKLNCYDGTTWQACW
jgi:hypothetical protein